eukprot:jgi/Botrbrau1/19837/Bobra.0124s0074.1
MVRRRVQYNRDANRRPKPEHLTLHTCIAFRLTWAIASKDSQHSLQLSWGIMGERGQPRLLAVVYSGDVNY